LRNHISTVLVNWALRDYQLEPKVWDGNENCEHKWSGKLKTLSHKSGETNPGKEGWFKDKGASDDRGNQFCSKCGAWKGSLGLEPTFDLYIKHLCDIFDEVKRVLKKTGTCWVNMGDTYNSHFAKSKNVGGFDGKQMRKNQAYSNSRIIGKRGVELPDKCLLQIPSRFAIEMCNRGWILRNVVIWHKPNCMPSSVKDRFTVNWEYVFFFVKSSTPQYWVNSKTGQITDKQPKGTQGIEGVDWGWVEHSACKGKGCGNKRCVNGKIKSSLWEGRDYWFETQYEPWGNDEREAGIIRAKKYGYDGKGTYQDWYNNRRKKTDWVSGNKNIKKGMYASRGQSQNKPPLIHPLGRNKRSVWKIPTQAMKEAHFAVYPEKLCETPIKAGCPEFICKKCGKARERIDKVEYQPYKTGAKSQVKTSPNDKGDLRQGCVRPQQMKYGRANKIVTNKGYTDCGCNAGWRPGIVLDPFLGSGTTAVVAKKLGRHYLGIELNPEYIKIAEKRLAQQQLL